MSHLCLPKGMSEDEQYTCICNVIRPETLRCVHGQCVHGHFRASWVVNKIIMRSLSTPFHRTCPHRSHLPRSAQRFAPFGLIHRQYNSSSLVRMPVNDLLGAKRHKSGTVRAESQTAIDQGIPVPEILQSRGRNIKVNYIRRDGEYEVSQSKNCAV